jgi:hypothetical protein
MSEDFGTEVLAYLLDEMSTERRSAFEQRLERDPALRAELKACADSLAHFAIETAPAEPMMPGDQRVALAAILNSTQAKGASTPGNSSAIAWPRVFWPIAAALLLALNLVQFHRPIDPRVREGRSLEQERRAFRQVPGQSAEGRDVAGSGKRSTSPSGEHLAELAASSDVNTEGGERGTDASPLPPRVRQQLVQLRRENSELQQSNSLLRADYDAALRHLADRAILERGVGRIAAMELVDAASYARGERKGLLEVARSILTAPGVVVDAPLQTAAPGPGSAGNNGTETASTTEPRPISPYAWAVFDEQESRGYVNLYNLPPVAADQSLQLWVKPVEATTYHLVGEVPAQLPGGSGSYYYTLPPSSPPPAEILITQEPRNVPPVAPAGTVVLRGP